MTAADVLDVIARLIGCAGQATDAVSAYIHIKMEDVPTMLELPRSKSTDNWLRQPRSKWAKTWQNIEEPMDPLVRNLYGHLLIGLLWERQFKKVLLENEIENAPSWECLFVYRQQCLFLSAYVHDIKMAEKEAESGVHVEEIDGTR